MSTDQTMHCPVELAVNVVPGTAGIHRRTSSFGVNFVGHYNSVMGESGLVVICDL